MPRSAAPPYHRFGSRRVGVGRARSGPFASPPLPLPSRLELELVPFLEQGEEFTLPEGGEGTS